MPFLQVQIHTLRPDSRAIPSQKAFCKLISLSLSLSFGILIMPDLYFSSKTHSIINLIIVILGISIYLLTYLLTHFLNPLMATATRPWCPPPTQLLQHHMPCRSGASWPLEAARVWAWLFRPRPPGWPPGWPHCGGQGGWGGQGVIGGPVPESHCASKYRHRHPHATRHGLGTF